MIGSTLSRMAAAEKLSIPQLQQAIKDGTIPAYVGIPLLQDKVKMEQQAKMAAAGAQQGKPPTVADQVMQQATAEEAQNRMPQGVDQLPVEAPSMAGGGIVAFAEGGDAEDTDYQDYLDGAQEEDDRAMQQAHLSRLKAISEAPGDMSYKQVAGGQLAAGQKAGAYKGITGDHKYSDLIRSEAKKVGLDPDYALKIAMIETGGLKNPESARSKAGAIGIMQLMPATAKGLGVDPTVPEENVRGGVSMLKRLVDKYGDYQLAGAAYNAGEGRVDRALKSGNLAGLPGETQGYMGKIRGMKEGGIAHFDVGGVTTYDPVTGEPYTEEGTTGATADIINFFKRSAQQARGIPEGSSGIGLPAAVQSGGASPRALENKSMTQFKAAEPTLPKTVKKEVAPTVEAAPAAAPAPAPQAKPAEASPWDEYIKSMMGKEKSRAEQADQDKWMSLLTAGLGMMGGTSPYAAANIGQGAMAGISNYAQMRKQAATQEAADTKNLLMAQRYREMGEQGQAQIEATKQYREAAMGSKDTGRMEGILNRLENTYITKAKQAAENELTPEKKKAAYDAAYAGLYQDPVYKKVYTSYFGEPPTIVAPSAPAGFRIVK